MQAIESQASRRAGSLFLSALLAFPTFALAQDPPAPPPPPSAADQQPPAPAAPTSSNSGWKRIGDQATQQDQAPASTQQPAPAPLPPPAPAAPNSPAGQQAPQYGAYPPPQYGQPTYNQGYPQGYPAPTYQQQPVPASLTMPAGAYLTVRLNQLLSSDKNQAGDAFSATLQRPVVVNGVVVAEPGQTIGGHVVEAVKAGHVSGLARLGVQLTDLALVDGQQIPVKTSLVSRTGPSSVGQDAGAIVGTTGLGAAVGAAAAWGRGAAIGAGAGAALGIVGVLVTRGHPSILYPEQILTFKIEEPVTIDTTHASQAFRYIEPGEYAQQTYNSTPYPQQRPLAPAPYYYGYPYPYPYYPYYWGPGVSFYFGRPYWGGYRYYGGPYIRGGIGIRRR